jgi:hypothetical protein
MASILDRYGIKEVADVTFYEIDANGNPGKPVLFLDTLKVSTIEQTAETAEARGGKGNPVLISWDYGKEINVSIEDALFSPKSMNIMFGSAGANLEPAKGEVTKTSVVRIGTDGKLPTEFTAEVYDKNNGSAKKAVVIAATATAIPAGKVHLENSGATLVSVTLEDGTDLNIATEEAWLAYLNADQKGKKAFVKYTVQVTKTTITIDGNSFPGTYYVTGDTYARSDVDGKDQFFQFIIPKAKMQAENTITLEAEGDPSVFNMSLKVLRPDSGKMMELVQYNLEAPAQG